MIVRLTALHPRDLAKRKVPAIKILRNYSGWGLKESKEVIDEMVSNGQVDIDINRLSHGNWTDMRREFQGEDILAELKRELVREYQVYAEEIRSIAAQAILAGHDDLAKDLQMIITTYGMSKKAVDILEEDATLEQ